jgi:glutamine amidotransferase
MKIIIIDYGAGNVKSVFNAIKEIDANINVVISNSILELKSANYFILPGVGAFGDCVDSLKAIDGFLPELRNQILNYKKPFLGICVGMQVLASLGYENGEHQGLGFINGKVEKIPENGGLKIPQMGWNSLKIKAPNHHILKNIQDDQDVYFANSYHFVAQNENNVLAYAEYGVRINAIIAKENIVGAQFHPEKSGEVGLQFLKNFITWRPKIFS